MQFLKHIACQDQLIFCQQLQVGKVPECCFWRMIGESIRTEVPITFYNANSAKMSPYDEAGSCKRHQSTEIIME